MSFAHILELAFLRLPWWWHETALFQGFEGCIVRPGRRDR